METFSALLAFLMGIHWSWVDSPHKGPVLIRYDALFDVSLTKWLKKVKLAVI